MFHVVEIGDEVTQTVEEFGVVEAAGGGGVALVVDEDDVFEELVGQEDVAAGETFFEFFNRDGSGLVGVECA